jgi:hypothetical protein
MSSDTRVCPVCGTPAPISAAYCGVCGADLKPTDDARQRDGEVLTVEEQISAIRRTLASLDQRLARLEAVPRSGQAPAPTAPTRAPSGATPAPGPQRREPVAPTPPAPTDVAGRLPPPLRVPDPGPAAPSQRQPFTFDRDLERLVGGQILAWVGGLSLFLGAVFFLSLAFSRGWIGPEARVVIGLIAGAAMLVAGGWLFERRERLIGHVLVAVGLGVVSTALFAATPRLYDIVRVEVALLGVLVAAVLAAVIAIRAGSQVVAAYGLIAGFIAPPLLGADPSGTTIAFLSALLVGTTVIALYRSWRWLPALAFLLSAPQLISWITGDPSRLPALLAIGGYWALHAVAAGGEEFRVRRHTLSVTSTTLLVANATLVVWMGFWILSDDAEGWRGLFLLVLALAHFALAAYFLYEEGDRHPFGMLAFGTGVAAVTIAIPVQMGGPAAPIGWAAQAVALTWVAVNRRHGYSGFAALVLGALAMGHFVLREYPWWEVSEWTGSRFPFLNASGGTLVFLLGALAVAGYLSHHRFAQVTFGAVGALLVFYAIAFELSGLWQLASWSLLFVLVVAAWRFVPHRFVTAGFSDGVLSPLYVPMALIALFATAHLVLVVIPLGQYRVDMPVTPFTDKQTLGALIAIVASLAAGFVARTLVARRVGIVAAAAFAAYLMPSQLENPGVVVAWSTLALALVVAHRWDVEGTSAYVAAAGSLVVFGFALTMISIAPLNRLGVSATSTVDHPVLWSGATAALGSLVVALFAGYWRLQRYPLARWLAVAGAGTMVYLLSVGLVDEFQRRVVLGTTPLADLQEQAQAGLSILWATLGGIAFVAGVVRGVLAARVFGLVLLAITTVKVFLYDLASLDAAYRVLSFIGLGILLLLSAYVYQRLMPGSDKQEASP